MDFNTYLDDDDGDGDFAAVTATVAKSLPAGLYSYNYDMGMMKFQSEDVTDSKIILDAEQKRILDQISFFWNARPKFLHLGLPHKRSVLLYGPPGTGKTTITRSVMQDVIERRNGIVFQIENIDELPIAIEAVSRLEKGERPLLLLGEDVERYGDRYFTQILDGLFPLDNVLFLFTTNDLDNISKKVKNRPSRIDEKIEIGWPSEETRKSYIQGIVPEASEQEIESLVADTANISIAHIKEVVIQRYIYLKQSGEITALLSKFRQDCKENLLEYGGGEDEEPTVAVEGRAYTVSRGR